MGVKVNERHAAPLQRMFEERFLCADQIKLKLNKIEMAMCWSKIPWLRNCPKHVLVSGMVPEILRQESWSFQQGAKMAKMQLLYVILPKTLG